MSCKNNISKKSCGCGCGNKPLQTQHPCPPYNECESQNKCSEMFCGDCIMFCGEKQTLTMNGNSFDINQGDRLTDVLQKLMLFLRNPNTDSANIPSGLNVVYAADSKIKISWNDIEGCSFNIYYKKQEENIYKEIVAGKTTSYEINNLEPGIYNIYIKNVIAEAPSLILTVKLK